MSLRTDEFLTQSAINAQALSDFATRYPLIVSGNQFTDSFGDDWQYTHIGAYRGLVFVYAKYVTPMAVVTEYEANINEIMYRNGLYPFVLSFVTTIATSYTENDLLGAVITQITIDGGAALNPATDYTFDPDTATINFLLPIMPGQTIDVLYKKSPYIAY